MRPKHKKDGNNAKRGYVGGNPRYGKANGNHRGCRQKSKRNAETAYLESR